jgi:hypothetical protein
LAERLDLALQRLLKNPTPHDPARVHGLCRLPTGKVRGSA